MREQRMIKPCMQRFDKALTYEHVNVREYNLVHACNSHTYTCTQKHARHPNAGMFEHMTEHTRSCSSAQHALTCTHILNQGELVPYKRRKMYILPAMSVL